MQDHFTLNGVGKPDVTRRFCVSTVPTLCCNCFPANYAPEIREQNLTVWRVRKFSCDRCACRFLALFGLDGLGGRCLLLRAKPTSRSHARTSQFDPKRTFDRSNQTTCFTPSRLDEAAEPRIKKASASPRCCLPSVIDVLPICYLWDQEGDSGVMVGRRITVKARLGCPRKQECQIRNGLQRPRRSAAN